MAVVVQDGVRFQVSRGSAGSQLWLMSVSLQILGLHPALLLGSALDRG